MRKILGIQMSRGQRLGFWIAAAFFGFGTIVAVLLFLLSKRDVGTLKRDVSQMRGDIGRMTEYLDGLPKSDPAVRKPFELGYAAMDASRWDEATGHFREAMKEAQGTQLVALLNLVGACQYEPGNLDAALRDCEASALLAEFLGDQEGLAEARGNIGVIYKDKGELDTALVRFEEALSIFRETKDKQGMAGQLGNIGVIYKNRGEPDTALKYLEEALSIFRETKDKQGEADQLVNVGNIYRIKGEFVMALKYLEEGLAIAGDINDQQGVTDGLVNIGYACSARGDTDKALGYFEQALTIARTIQYQRGAVTALADIGLTLVNQSTYEDAVPRLVEALRISQAIGLASLSHEVTGALIRCEDRLGRKRMEDLLRQAGPDGESAAGLLDAIGQARRLAVQMLQEANRAKK